MTFFGVRSYCCEQSCARSTLRFLSFLQRLLWGVGIHSEKTGKEKTWNLAKFFSFPVFSVSPLPVLPHCSEEAEWRNVSIFKKLFKNKKATVFSGLVLVNCQLRQDPLEANLVIFGRSFLNFFFERSWKNKKMIPLLCACAVVITLETQKCRKWAPRFVEFNFFTNRNRRKRLSQNERRRAYQQQFASKFLIFAWD